MAPSALAIPNIVITDGDARPSRRGVEHAGIRRALRLIGDGERTSLTALFEAGDYPGTKSALEAVGLFVGDETLELDLAASNAAILIEGLGDIGFTAKALTALESDLPLALGGDVEACDRVMQKIDRVGKGRLGQRLAHRATEIVPPPYIEKGIRSIVDLVTAVDASTS